MKFHSFELFALTVTGKAFWSNTKHFCGTFLKIKLFNTLTSITQSQNESDISVV